jgi:hypothetical protein
MRPLNILLVLSLFAMMACSKKSKNIDDADSKPWDGRYSMDGTVSDFFDANFHSAGPQEYSLIPDASGKVTVLSKALAFNGLVIKNKENLSYYANFGLIITIDPVTNKVTGLVNSYGQPSATNGRSAMLDPSGVNSFDPATKNLKLKFWMDETGFIGHRVAFDLTWTYIGAR